MKRTSGSGSYANHGRSRFLWRIAVVLCLSALVLAVPASFAASEQEENRKKHLAKYGGGAGLIAAQDLKVEEIMGKKVGWTPGREKRVPARLGQRAVVGVTEDAHAPSPITDAPGSSANNVAVRDFPNVAENEPTVVVNPKHSKRLVAGTHFIGDGGNRCVAHYSSDGGKTWSLRPSFMPQLTHESECSDPVLAYAPDGNRVYYAYMDIKFSHFDILVSWSDNDGKTWNGPVIALASSGIDYDKPWIGTHVPVGGNQSNKNWVYVSATRFPFSGPNSGGCFIDFTRSSDKGQNWSPPQTLDGNAACDPVVQGSRPSGGLNNNVLVGWFNSGADGWLNGSFQINTRYSSNNGGLFNPIVPAAVDTTELSFYLGPNFAYHRWWGGMFPDVEIAQNGSAHIGYIHDPAAGPATAEEGDVRYVSSAGPPYGAWTAKVTLNDDASGKAQGWVALEAVSSKGSTTVYAIWEDHRTSPSDNFEYDVFSTKRTGTTTQLNKKVTDARSRSDFFFLGDYYDIGIAGSGEDDKLVYGVWTDRRDEPSEFDFDDDIWGGRIDGSSDDDDDDDDNDDNDDNDD